MSRYTHKITKQHVDYEVAYGYDQPLQEYFLQVFRLDKQDDYDFDPTGEGMMINESSLLTNRSNGFMLNLFNIWGAKEEHQEQLTMDLPF